jgi:hypothetical protein
MKKVFLNLILVLSLITQSTYTFAAANEDLKSAAAAQLTELQLENLKMAVAIQMMEKKFNKFLINENDISRLKALIETSQSIFNTLALGGVAALLIGVATSSFVPARYDLASRNSILGSMVAAWGGALIVTFIANPVFAKHTESFIKNIRENEDVSKQMKASLSPLATLLGLNPSQFDQLIIAVKNKIADHVSHLPPKEMREFVISHQMKFELDTIEIAKESKIIDGDMASAAKDIFKFMAASTKPNNLTLKDALSINIQAAEQIHQIMIQIVSSKEFDKLGLDRDKNHALESITRLQNLIDASKDFQAAI